MLSLIEVGFKDLPRILEVVLVLAVIAAYIYREVKRQGGSYKDEVISDLTKLVNGHKGRIEDLTTGLEACKAEHAKCQLKINSITAFNLRLQARETGYQKSINRMEHRLGITPTDFTDVIHAPEDPNFG